uniref:Uncharacterized protein n=1 Tax=Glossina pallidipes TaxID=7398 RepID=A0A1A9ZR44_GLOPL
MSGRLTTSYGPSYDAVGQVELFLYWLRSGSLYCSSRWDVVAVIFFNPLIGKWLELTNIAFRHLGHFLSQDLFNTSAVKVDPERNWSGLSGPCISLYHGGEILQRTRLQF